MSRGNEDRGLKKWITNTLAIKDVSGIVSDYVHNELMNWEDLSHHEMCVIIQTNFPKFASWSKKKYGKNKRKNK